MIDKFDHVGLAVTNTEETAALLSRLFGMETAEVRTEAEAGFKSTLVSNGTAAFELIEPVGPQGMIQRFIEKRGGGLHHISLQVSSLDEEMTRLQELGVQFASDKPAQVTETTKVIFIHPRSTNGLLIELMQRS
jgi:methylmalonyl-CoA/ethylmalonyl-CoA epimerase